MRLLLALLLAGCGASSRGPRDAGVDPRDACVGDGCAADCEDDPTAAGCACDAVNPEACYEGPPGTAGTGTCAAGLRSCEDGAWTSCESQVLPRDEVCDGLDDDCDGTADDGVVNACGTCGDDCLHVRFGHEPGDEPFDARSGDCAVRDGDLVLPEGPVPAFVWIPNTPEGTISLIDAGSRTEIGRFRTGEDAASDNPSRTSVDHEGAVYVANRSTDGRSSVTRIRARSCPDVDGNARLDTSRGRDDVLPWGEDECVDWHEAVGGRGGAANAVVYQVRPALDGALEERVWVGLENEERYVELDAHSGEATGSQADCSGCRPTGARTDPDDRLWSACEGAQVCFFDTTVPDGSAEILDLPIGSGPAVGLAVDHLGRVWVGGAVEVYDPLLGSFTEVPGVTATTLVLGYDGMIWAGGCADAASGLEGTTCRIDVDTLAVTALDAPSRGIDTNESGVWAVPADGTAGVIDPETLAVDIVLDDCNGPCLSEPDTWSGMASPVTLTTAQGRCEWRGLVRGCSEAYETWWVLSWDAETPLGSQIAVEARASREPGGLDREVFVPVASIPPDTPPVDLGDPLIGEFIEIQVTMRSTGVMPVLHSLQVRWSCVVSN
ncbi:MAG: hypothetical protein HYY06_20685 [Deltaproteobacteria bacterium]|nr:hypothetical protein [Deltaproteobacteria bacterium]